MKNILLLLAKGFESYEAGAFIDVLGWNLVDGDGTTRMVTCGMEKEVVGSFGVRIRTDVVIEEVAVDEYDALAIPGGFEEYGFYDEAYDPKFLGLIRSFHEHGKIVASICTGALPVGKSGILNRRKGTTYNLNNTTRQNQLSELGVDVVDEPVVLADRIITSWNPSTAVYVALKLLELLTSPEKADHIREIMGFPKLQTS